MERVADPSEILLELGLSSSATDEEKALVSLALSKAEAAVANYLRYDPVLRTRTEYYPQSGKERQLSRTVWESDSNTAYLRGIAPAVSNELQVKHIPIRDSTSMNVWIDYDGRSGAGSNAFPSDSLKTEGTDYWPNYDSVDEDGNKVCHDGVLRSFGLWPTVSGSVKVTYTAGYTDGELRGESTVLNASPIREAVVMEAARRVKRALTLFKKTSRGWMTGQITGENLGDYSYSISPGAGASNVFGSMSGLLLATQQMLEPFVNLGWEM